MATNPLSPMALRALWTARHHLERAEFLNLNTWFGFDQYSEFNGLRCLLGSEGGLSGDDLSVGVLGQGIGGHSSSGLLAISRAHLDRYF